MVKSADEQRDTFGENVLHVGAGFKANERPQILETLSTLGPHLLGRWDARDIDVEVSLQDRGGKEQRVTLRTSLPGHPPLVAVAENPDISHALSDAKRELIRQLEHQKSVGDPMSSAGAAARRSAIRPLRRSIARIDKAHNKSAARSAGRRKTIMTHRIEPRVIDNHAAMGTSTPAVTDRP